MKLTQLMLFYTLSAFQITVMAGNGDSYGGAGTEVNVIQTSESQMISMGQIENAILTCVGENTENNIFKKVFGSFYASSNFEMSKKLGSYIDLAQNGVNYTKGEGYIWWRFKAYAVKKPVTKTSSKVELILGASNSEMQLHAEEQLRSVDECLPFPKDRCVTSRTYTALNIPQINFKAAVDIATTDRDTGDIIKTEKYFKGVTVEYDATLPPESTLYNDNSEKKPTSLRFPTRELAECLRVRLSNL